MATLPFFSWVTSQHDRAISSHSPLPGRVLGSKLCKGWCLDIKGQMFPWIPFREHLKRIWTWLVRKWAFFAFHSPCQQCIPKSLQCLCTQLISTHFQSHQNTSSEFTILHGPQEQVEMFNFRFLLMLRVMAQCSHCSCWGEIKLGSYFLNQTEMSGRDEINFTLNKLFLSRHNKELFLSRHNKESPEGFA